MNSNCFCKLNFDSVACDVSCATCETSLVCITCAASYIPDIEGNCVQCGNGTIDAGEECDDSNNEDGDGCGSLCQYESEEAACSQSIALCSSKAELKI